MRKVMLVIDEIQQLHGLESFLRRLGFDVLSLGKESQVNDALLSFQPDILISSYSGRNVDGLKVARRMKKTMSPPPRVVMSYTQGKAPTLTKEDERVVDALMEIPATGENAVRLLAQLGGIKLEPLLEKYKKFATAKLSQEEQMVIVGGANPMATGAQLIRSSAVEEPWDPVKNPGTSATSTTARSSKYEDFLANHAGDLANGAADKVMPRERASVLMKKLKEDSASEKDILDAIQAQKIKFAEALFEEDPKKKK